MRQATKQLIKDNNPFKRRDRQTDSTNVGTSRNSRRDLRFQHANPISIPIPNNTTHDSIFPNALRNKLFNRMKPSSESRGSQRESSSNNISSNTPSGSQSLPSYPSHKNPNKRKAAKNEVIDISDDESQASQKKSRGRLKQYDETDNLVAFTVESQSTSSTASSVNIHKPVLQYPSTSSKKERIVIDAPENVLNQQETYERSTSKSDSEHESCYIARGSTALTQQPVLSYPEHPVLSYPLEVLSSQEGSQDSIRRNSSIAKPESYSKEPEDVSLLSQDSQCDVVSINPGSFFKPYTIARKSKGPSEELLSYLDKLKQERATDMEFLPKANSLLDTPVLSHPMSTRQKLTEAKHKDSSEPSQVKKSISLPVAVDMDQNDNHGMSSTSHNPFFESCEVKCENELRSKKVKVNEDESLYLPPRKSRTRSEENALSCLVNIKSEPTPCYPVKVESDPVGSSSDSDSDAYVDALAPSFKDEEILEQEELNLLRKSQKRKGKQNETMVDKKHKVKEDGDAGAIFDAEEVTSPDVCSPILPFHPIDHYKVEPVGPDEHLLTYPFTGKNSVIIYERDMYRLKEETYLNDSLLDVFPKIWATEFPSASIHTFSSFFFARLSGPNHSACNYKNVQRWTAGVDIFDKKFLIIPINQHTHWYLLVVTNPGCCIQGEKGDQYHERFDYDSNEQSNGRPGRRSRKKMINAGQELNRNKPYIMILDPLGLSRNPSATTIKNYLKQEAFVKLGVQESEFLEPEVVMSPCPQQSNFTDCGVFCLRFIKTMYERTDDITETVYANSNERIEAWDRENTLPIFRSVLRRILKVNMKLYREHLLSSLESF